jgi:putative ABC transport system ATP-binding protein
MSTTDTAPVVACDRLVHTYRTGRDRVMALKGVDLTITAGETVALLGPSGAGKSTLLTLLAGLVTPTSGTLHVLGHDMGRLSERGRLGLRGLRIGLLLQDPGRNLLGWASTTENILFSQQAGRRRRAAKLRHARMLLEAVGLADLGRRLARELSGGEQQRLALAVALANAPDLLLADEPTSQLDAASGRRIVELLRDVNHDLGTTIVVVTHDPAVGAALSRTVTVADGRVDAQGPSGPDRSVAEEQDR